MQTRMRKLLLIIPIILVAAVAYWFISEDIPDVEVKIKPKHTTTTSTTVDLNLHTPETGQKIKLTQTTTSSTMLLPPMFWPKTKPDITISYENLSNVVQIHTDTLGFGVNVINKGKGVKNLFMDAWLADHHIKVAPKNMSLGGDKTKKILLYVQNIHLLEGDQVLLKFKSGTYEKNYTIKLNKTNTQEAEFIRRGGWRSG